MVALVVDDRGAVAPDAVVLGDLLLAQRILARAQGALATHVHGRALVLDRAVELPRLARGLAVPKRARVAALAGPGNLHAAVGLAGEQRPSVAGFALQSGEQALAGLQLHLRELVERDVAREVDPPLVELFGRLQKRLVLDLPRLVLDRGTVDRVAGLRAAGDPDLATPRGALDLVVVGVAGAEQVGLRLAEGADPVLVRNGGGVDLDLLAAPHEPGLCRPCWVGGAERERDGGGGGRARDLHALEALEGLPVDREGDEFRLEAHGALRLNSTAPRASGPRRSLACGRASRSGCAPRGSRPGSGRGRAPRRARWRGASPGR